VKHKVINVRYFHLPLRAARSIRIAWLNAILAAIEENTAQGQALVGQVACWTCWLAHYQGSKSIDDAETML
jgi:hypothetical protein